MGFEPMNNSFADCPHKPLEHLTIILFKIKICWDKLNQTTSLSSRIHTIWLVLSLHHIPYFCCSSGSRTHTDQAPKTCALPLRYRAKFNIVLQKGFEPSTPTLRVLCASQLCHWSLYIICSPYQNRTDDLFFRRELFFHLN